jgi:hypothetical protein
MDGNMGGGCLAAEASNGNIGRSFFLERGLKISSTPMTKVKQTRPSP